MLRRIVLAIALLLAAAGVWLLALGVRVPGFQALGLGSLVFLGTVFESWRYRKQVPPGAQWQHTDEKFADPVTGEELEVQYDPVSGERRYVPR